MKHSEYNELTRRLSFYSREADRTREFMADPGGIVIWRSVNEADTDLSRWMDERADGWIESNQERADKDLEPTADVRALYDAMSKFISATEKPDPRGVLYEKTRNRCLAWTEQAVTWFPELVPFLPKLLDTELCKLAVKKGEMIRPITWNGTIKALAVLLEQTHVLDKTEQDKVASSTGGPGVTHWILADRVFRKNGKPITAQQLKQSITH